MILLGSKVKDWVTGLTGVVICRVEYLNGCVQYGVKPPVGKDGKMFDCQYVDEGQLTVKRGGQPEAAPKQEPARAPAPSRRPPFVGRRGIGGPSSDAPGDPYEADDGGPGE